VLPPRPCQINSTETAQKTVTLAPLREVARHEDAVFSLPASTVS
jgi:hypothetical protein